MPYESSGEFYIHCTDILVWQCARLYKRNIRKLCSEKRSGTTFQLNLLLLYCIYIVVPKDYSVLTSLWYLYEPARLHDKIQNFKTCE